jgi:hypothetical protein
VITRRRSPPPVKTYRSGVQFFSLALRRLEFFGRHWSLSFFPAFKTVVVEPMALK